MHQNGGSADKKCDVSVTRQKPSKRARQQQDAANTTISAPQLDDRTTNQSLSTTRDTVVLYQLQAHHRDLRVAHMPIREMRVNANCEVAHAPNPDSRGARAPSASAPHTNKTNNDHATHKDPQSLQLPLHCAHAQIGGLRKPHVHMQCSSSAA